MFWAAILATISFAKDTWYNCFFLLILGVNILYRNVTELGLY